MIKLCNVSSENQFIQNPITVGRSLYSIWCLSYRKHWWVTYPVRVYIGRQPRPAENTCLQVTTHLYVELAAGQYCIPLYVHVSRDLHPKRNPYSIMILHVLQQFVFMHWLWSQYRELRLNKLAHAAAALSVAFGYNCGMGDIRTTTEAQGKERWSIGSARCRTRSSPNRSTLSASRTLSTTGCCFFCYYYRFYYLMFSPWSRGTLKTSTANNWKTKCSSETCKSCVRVCVNHQWRSCAPRWQRRNRQNTVTKLYENNTMDGDLFLFVCVGQLARGGWYVRRRPPVTSRRSFIAAAFYYARHGTSGPRVSSMTVLPTYRLLVAAAGTGDQ